MSPLHVNQHRFRAGRGTVWVDQYVDFVGGDWLSRIEMVQGETFTVIDIEWWLTADQLIEFKALTDRKELKEIVQNERFVELVQMIAKGHADRHKSA